METNQAVIDKIIKLLALAEGEGANPNEAAVAAARAAELLERHKLDRADIEASSQEPDEDVTDGGELPGVGGTRIPKWCGLLASSIAAANGCKLLYWSRQHRVTKKWGRYIVIIGRPSDVAVVKYIHTYVAREIDRLRAEAKDRGEIYGDLQSNNFRCGAVDAVRMKLNEAKRETREQFRREGGSSNAIVLVKQRDAKVDLWMHNKFPKLRGGQSWGGSHDHDAYAAGKRAGATISMNRGLEGKPIKALKGG